MVVHFDNVVLRDLQNVILTWKGFVQGAAAFETIRDINVASRLVGDMSGSTLDDPLFDRYKKLGCSISPLEKDTDDFKMVAKYLEKTYEPVKVGEIVGSSDIDLHIYTHIRMLEFWCILILLVALQSYGVTIDDVFDVELSACPSLDEIKKLPNKVLLWCGEY